MVVTGLAVIEEHTFGAAEGEQGCFSFGVPELEATGVQATEASKGLASIMYLQVKLESTIAESLDVKSMSLLSRVSLLGSMDRNPTASFQHRVLHCHAGFSSSDYDFSHLYRCFYFCSSC